MRVLQISTDLTTVRESKYQRKTNHPWHQHHPATIIKSPTSNNHLTTTPTNPEHVTTS
jgi:hypothetical protein